MLTGDILKESYEQCVFLAHICKKKSRINFKNICTRLFFVVTSSRDRILQDHSKEAELGLFHIFRIFSREEYVHYFFYN